MRYDTALRTNTFEVADRLDGLQKKFQVVGNDPLADALRSRLDELETKRHRYAPDVLSLFLELSDRPAARSKVDSVKVPPQTPPEGADNLTWADLGTSETFGQGEEDIWRDIDYTAETTDDSISLASSDVSIPRIVPQTSKVTVDEYVPPEDLFLSVDDEDLISRLRHAQTLEKASNRRDDTSTVFLTELQTVREVIFMLQGLPTALFKVRQGSSVEVDRKFASRHLHRRTFISALQSFSSVGTCIYRLRTCVKQRHHTPFMQTFQGELEHYLSAFDKHMSTVHGEDLTGAGCLRISMIQLLDDVRREAKFLRQLAELVTELESHTADEPFKCLNMLYDLVCSKQASGEDQEFRLALALFIKCFEVYMKPIRLWMGKGELAPSLGTFFISDAKKGGDIRTLWHDWFVLEEVIETPNAPKFLQPAVRKIFTTGKSIVFLRKLGAMSDSLPVESTRSICDDIFSPDDPGSLHPFSGLLGNSFDRLVNDSHMAASSLLRTQLGRQCGLWTSLQALEYIYLGKDLSRSALIDSKLFDLIDSGSQSWNDRFLLTELVQQAFYDLPCVDSSRLIARSRKVAHDEFAKQCRSVKILNALSIDYVLPWPIANIITRESLSSYQRLSTFLLQIRRSLYLLERQYLLRPSSDLRGEKDGETKPAFCIRYRLLQFLNSLYSHTTEVVISCSSAAMLNALAEAADVDTMISVHRAYMSSLEDQCLLSKRASEIYKAVMSILDLSIHFSDLMDSRLAQLQSEETNRPSGASADEPCNFRSRNRRLHDEEGYPSDDDEAVEAGNNVVDEVNTTSISFLETPYQKRLLDVKVGLDRLCTFVDAGLRGIGRSDGQKSWEVLADKLAWKKEALSQM